MQDAVSYSALSQLLSIYMHMYTRSHPRQLIFLRKSDCLGCAVLPCLVVCLTLLASFFLPSHLTIMNMHIFFTQTVWDKIKFYMYSAALPAPLDLWVTSLNCTLRLMPEKLPCLEEIAHSLIIHMYIQCTCTFTVHVCPVHIYNVHVHVYYTCIQSLHNLYKYVNVHVHVYTCIYFPF